MKYAQIGQDLFVLYLKDFSSKGKFLEIGCQRPFEISNSLLLEKKGWTGIAIDLIDYAKEWKARSTNFVQLDAIKCDYDKLLQQFQFPQHIEYLSIDLEQCKDRFRVLEKVLSTDYEFEIITIEHDAYKGKKHEEQEQLLQRHFLSEKGYHLVAANVSGRNMQPFEDWWVNPKFIGAKKYAPFLSNNKSYLELFETIGIDSTKYYH